MPTVPIDGRRQFSTTDVILGNVSLGRAPFAGVSRSDPTVTFWRTPGRRLVPVAIALHPFPPVGDGRLARHLRPSR